LLGIGKKCLLITLALLILLVIAGFTFPEANVIFTLDGKTRQARTKAKNVIGFLEEQDTAYKEQDFVFPPLSASIEEGTHITLQHAIPITVELNDKKERMFTLAPTVGEAVEGAGIKLEGADQITPGLDVQITKNISIVITKATSSMDVCRASIPYQTITQTDGNILQGRAEVVQEGKEGVAIQIFDVKSMDGQEVERKLKTERKICAPVDEVVKVGTKKAQRAKPKPVRFAAASGPVNVSRGGSGGGRVMKATAYSAGHGCGYTTATGGRAQYGVVAVDPRVIPLGTKLYIEGYGEAVAGDTGGAIKGNRIDLCYNSNSECVEFGRQDVVVHIK
jgi:uncharacterized protein YabE (DUF348 family)/3D (Asp-Asp-Asp) domain-containing protein